jgi:lipoprotein-anchoring transpeptidase ErfK/SrfK
VIGDVLYMPPLGSPYRMVRGALGHYRLNLGSSVGLHGTLDKESIGRAVTHGCLRLHDEDVEWLYLNVPIGTLVFIY